jgi:hypothetical protein
MGLLLDLVKHLALEGELFLLQKYGIRRNTKLTKN